MLDILTHSYSSSNHCPLFQSALDFKSQRKASFHISPENQELEWYIRDIPRDEFGYKSMKTKIADEFNV